MKMWRPFEPLYAKADDAGSGGAADDGGDAGFNEESASAAFTEAPADTTSGAESAAAVAETREESASADEGADEDATTDDSESSASAKPATERPADTTAAGTKKAGAKGNRTIDGRIEKLKKEIGTLTHQKHKTAAEIARDQQAAATLRTEVAELERKKQALTSGTADADATKKTDAATGDTMPEPPKYRDFDTDEAHEEAMAKWRKDVTAWHLRQIEGVKKDITDGVEARFKQVDQETASATALATAGTTLSKFAADKTDWDERKDAVEGLTSAWHDPEKSPNSTTPFLSDLSMSLLAEGREEGAEVLYWLGEDLDRAQRAADLLPSRPLRDAIVASTSPKALLEHFTTDEGLKEFDALKAMHPVKMFQAIGALSTRLASASRGSGATAKQTVTKASPSARPPAGASGTRAPGAGSADTMPSFDDWMKAEDERERQEKLKLAGVR